MPNAWVIVAPGKSMALNVTDSLRLFWADTTCPARVANANKAMSFRMAIPPKTSGRRLPFRGPIIYHILSCLRVFTQRVGVGGVLKGNDLRAFPLRSRRVPISQSLYYPERTSVQEGPAFCILSLTGILNHLPVLANTSVLLHFSDFGSGRSFFIPFEMCSNCRRQSNSSRNARDSRQPGWTLTNISRNTLVPNMRSICCRA